MFSVLLENKMFLKAIHFLLYSFKFDEYINNIKNINKIYTYKNFLPTQFSMKAECNGKLKIEILKTVNKPITRSLQKTGIYQSIFNILYENNCSGCSN